MKLRKAEPSMAERFLGAARVEPESSRWKAHPLLGTMLGGLRRLALVTVVAGGAGLGAGLLLARIRGGETWSDVAIAYYVLGALAVLAALAGRGRLGAGAYGEYSSSESVSAANAGRAMNLVIGVVLLGLGVLVDLLR